MYGKVPDMFRRAEIGCKQKRVAVRAARAEVGMHCLAAFRGSKME